MTSQRPYRETATPDLAAFLARQTPLAEARAIWGNGTLPLMITGYLSTEQPPLAYVTSVRCVLIRDNMVLLQRDREGAHILPGGRREQGETLEQTLRREVLEETGWTLTHMAVLGFLHFHHLAPMPFEYAPPHPDFLQIVYLAQAGELRPEAKLDDGNELESTFRYVEELRTLPLTRPEFLYLDAATASD